MLDLEALVPGNSLRQVTCGDGSGSITASKSVVRANAQFTHEEGVWAIVEGTGRFSTLRGRGTSVLDIISGDPADHITTRYNETWTGVIDFDVTRPEITITRASAIRLRRPKGAYSVRLVFNARDGNDGNAVSYTMTVTGPEVFVLRRGATASGTVSITFRVRPRNPRRTLRLVIVASDPVGNETRVTRQLRLPR
jgi:hypothetical protein